MKDIVETETVSANRMLVSIKEDAGMTINKMTQFVITLVLLDCLVIPFIYRRTNCGG